MDNQKINVLIAQQDPVVIKEDAYQIAHKEHISVLNHKNVNHVIHHAELAQVNLNAHHVMEIKFYSILLALIIALQDGS